jgi:hypothetical protein
VSPFWRRPFAIFSSVEAHDEFDAPEPHICRGWSLIRRYVCLPKQHSNIEAPSLVLGVTIQADDHLAVRSLLRKVKNRWGLDARIVLGEFLANAAEHCENHRVDVTLRPGLLIARDYGGGLFCRKTRKPPGEGGYGLTIIEGFGGVLTHWRKGTRLEYRFPMHQANEPAKDEK